MAIRAGGDAGFVGAVRLHDFRKGFIRYVAPSDFNGKDICIFARRALRAFGALGAFGASGSVAAFGAVFRSLGADGAGCAVFDECARFSVYRIMQDDFCAGFGFNYAR